MIETVCVGKVRDEFVRSGMQEYLKRMQKYHKVMYREVGSLNIDFDTFDGVVIALDEHGKQYGSVSFASFLKPIVLERKVMFVIGGADGFDSVFLKKCTFVVSLSSMTFPHQLVRLIFIEQLYRAFTILAGEKYHREG